MGAYYNKFSNREKTNNSNKKNICCCCFFLRATSRNGLPIVCTSSRSSRMSWMINSWRRQIFSFLSFCCLLFVCAASCLLPFAYSLLFVVYCLHLMALWGKNAMSMALGTRHSAHGTWAISVSLLSTPEHLPLRGEKMEKMRMVDEDDRVVVICPPKVVTACVVLCCCGCCCCCFVLPCCILRVLRIM